MRYGLLGCLVLLGGCDEARRPRTDFDEGDAAVDAARTADGGAHRLDGTAPPDAARPPRDGAVDGGVSVDVGWPMDAGVTEPDAARDGAPPDAAPLDQGADAALDQGADAALDQGADAALDAASPADALADQDAAPPTGFVTGEAYAADGRTPVTVSAGPVSTVAEDGRFQLGPLPPGLQTLVFRAPEHQRLTVDVDVPERDALALEEPKLLYRGQRLGERAGGVLQFRFEGGYVIWSVGDALWSSALDPIAPRALLREDLEVFMGFVPGREEAVVRRRTMPGVAGDIEVLDLVDGGRARLFVEAQPWVRWRGEEALGMVHTREALSRLVIGRPGAEPRVIGEGVPWLLVTELSDGAPAWAEHRADAPGTYGIWRGGVDGAPRTPVAPDFPASDAFLMTTPGRGGLMWLGPTADLVRWEPELGGEVLAEAVAASPRPRFLADGRLLFWREDPELPALRRLFVLEPGGERLLVDGADGGTFRTSGDGYYVVRPDQGLWYGLIDGAGEDILAGQVIQYALDGPGVVALVDGAARRVIPGGRPEPLGVEGLTRLQAVSTGATAWQAETGSLWYLPGPERAIAPSALVEGAPRAARFGERRGSALYVLGPEGYRRAPVPPGPPQTIFDEPITAGASVSPAALLGWNDGEWLYQIDPTTGRGFGWAASVTRVALDGDGTLALYVSDRGTFLATIPE